jgi:hypothetical protein
MEQATINVLIILLVWLSVIALIVWRKNRAKGKGKKTTPRKTKRDKLDKLRSTFRLNEYFALHERSQKEYPISIGETVTLWQKPGTNQFNVYHKNSVSGSGYLGHFKSWTLANLYPVTEYKLKARIGKFDEKVDRWDDVTVYFEKRLIATKL